ncbi:MAG TPA: efflux RND transporter periplasmic adaptor subunit [Burkholderiaceae bacterium]|nr:efflux RND transporter periplasmic adaptor subunit [Burkholderiaceae bacterium]
MNIEPLPTPAWAARCRMLRWATAGALWLAATVNAAAPAVPTLLAQPGGEGGALVLDGTVQAVRQSTLAAQVAGNVVTLAVKAGDRVKGGQVIARIDDRDAQAGLMRAQAGVAEAQAQWRNAQLNSQRTRDLRAQGFISQSALDVADTQLQAAQANLNQAQAAQAQAALVRGFATVSAPFDAVVLATLVEAGDLATPGRALATVYAPGAMRAVVQVPSSRAALAREAQQLQVLLPDGRAVEPSARTVLPSADPVSQTVEWRLDLPTEALPGLLSGQTVEVRFAAAGAGPAATIVVPSAAVLRRGELTAVYVVQGDRFVLRAVRAGRDRAAAGTEVYAGLQPGERVAADAVRAGLAGAVPQAGASPLATR